MSKIIADKFSALQKVSVINPTNEKLNDMLDFCWVHRLQFYKYTSSCDFNGNSSAIFYFGDAELATVFKLKFA